MGWPSTLVLVRHAESEGNIRSPDERATFGKSTANYALTERGRRQAECTRDYLNSQLPNGFDVRYTSYYTRAKQTMEIVSSGKKWYEDPRLAEGQRGIYHTYTRDEVSTYFPKELERKALEGLYHYRPIGGENWPDIELRIHSFLGTLARDCSGKHVLIVVHGHWLLLFQKLIHHYSIEEVVQRYQNSIFENASVTTYKSYGDHLHLHCVSENVIPWRGKL